MRQWRPDAGSLNKLPVELRQMIYVFALEDSKNASSLGPSILAPLSSPLLRLNWATRREVLPILLQHQTLVWPIQDASEYIENTWYLHQQLRQSMRPEGPHTITEEAVGYIRQTKTIIVEASQACDPNCSKTGDIDYGWDDPGNIFGKKLVRDLCGIMSEIPELRNVKLILWPGRWRPDASSWMTTLSTLRQRWPEPDELRIDIQFNIFDYCSLGIPANEWVSGWSHVQGLRTAFRAIDLDHQLFVDGNCEGRELSLNGLEQAYRADINEISEDEIDGFIHSEEAVKCHALFIKPGARLMGDDRIEYIQRMKHQHLVGVKHIFSMPEETFVAFEFMPLSLAEIAGHPLMDDIRLASILGQVVKGVIYLDSNCLEHTQLNCSNILVDAYGNVKLWAYEHIQGRSTRGKNVQSLGRRTMQLIQGYVNDEGRGGLDELQSCPVGADFYSETKKALSVESLTKHPLLRLDWHKQRLAGMVSLALIWADRGYKFCI